MIRSWWETQGRRLSPSDLDAEIAAARRQTGWYRADRGAVPEPTSADLRALCDVLQALEERIAIGLERLEAEPGHPGYQRALALLRRDRDATLVTFERANELYKAEFDAEKGLEPSGR